MKNEDKQLHVRIPDKVYKKLKVTCVYKDVSMQDYVAKLIAESLPEYFVGGHEDKASGNSKTRRGRLVDE